MMSYYIELPTNKDLDDTAVYLVTSFQKSAVKNNHVNVTLADNGTVELPISFKDFREHAEESIKNGSIVSLWTVPKVLGRI